ncbi:hypothetical protein [Rhizobium sp. BK399]|uniref:hypothetical protein n=1 Tax=Rhizobium sp. BK399 TaxID=2587063 RepID=UPI00160FB8ED|nr:hypothetical protein [Rhizobium sp. BK399]MBB3544869.1 hypothetical protein [Rhizobium sp. BK399]
MRLYRHDQTTQSFHQDMVDERVAEANQFIDQFLLFIRDNEIGNDLIDEIELPVAKSMLISAFRISIAAERRPDIRALLIKAGLTLAQYRSGLGNRITMKSVTPHGRLRQPQSHVFEQRLRRALVAVAAERIQLGDHFQRAFVESFH